MITKHYLLDLWVQIVQSLSPSTKEKKREISSVFHVVKSMHLGPFFVLIWWNPKFSEKTTHEAAKTWSHGRHLIIWILILLVEEWRMHEIKWSGPFQMVTTHMICLSTGESIILLKNQNKNQNKNKRQVVCFEQQRFLIHIFYIWNFLILAYLSLYIRILRSFSWSRRKAFSYAY